MPVLIRSMPIPKIIATLNKYVTNSLFLLFARWLPPFAIVNHQGRKSGRRYRTPILAFPTDTGFVFALTYGRNVDWVRNLMASDGGTLEYKGDEVPIRRIRIVKYDDMTELFPYWIRSFLGLISVEDCVLAEVNTSDNLSPDHTLFFRMT